MKMKMKLKDPGSAITHFIAMILVILGAAPMLLKATREPDNLHFIALSVFVLSMILLYMASTIYHSLDINENVNRRLRKIDHMMIFILIAGSYTPICLLALKGRTGILLCVLVWAVAILGILIKAFWITCPKWFSSVIYIGMGWLCVLAFSQIFHALSRPAFGWLLAGGIIYTAGGIIYALKVPLFDAKHKNFGSHEIFHLFVMGGSACHFVTMFLLA